MHGTCTCFGSDHQVLKGASAWLAIDDSYCLKQLHMSLTANLGRRSWSGKGCENLLYAAARAPTRQQFVEAMADIRSTSPGKPFAFYDHCTSSYNSLWCTAVAERVNPAVSRCIRVSDQAPPNRQPMGPLCVPRAQVAPDRQRPFRERRRILGPPRAYQAHQRLPALHPDALQRVDQEGASKVRQGPATTHARGGDQGEPARTEGMGLHSPAKRGELPYTYRRSVQSHANPATRPLLSCQLMMRRAYVPTLPSLRSTNLPFCISAAAAAALEVSGV